MILGRRGRSSAGEEQGGLEREFAEPFSTEPAAEDRGEQQGQALLAGPSLRNGVEPLQGVADGGDSFGDAVAFLPRQADFDGALAAVRGEPRHSVEQGGPTGNDFAVVLAVIESGVEVPPVVKERDGSPALPAPSCPLRLLGGWP